MQTTWFKSRGRELPRGRHIVPAPAKIFRVNIIQDTLSGGQLGKIEVAAKVYFQQNGPVFCQRDIPGLCVNCSKHGGGCEDVRDCPSATRSATRIVGSILTVAVSLRCRSGGAQA